MTTRVAADGAPFLVEDSNNQVVGIKQPDGTEHFFDLRTVQPASYGAQGARGTATNDNAAAGQVGEFISSTVLNAAQVALTNNTPANVTSISLTAGDWDVEGIVWAAFGGGTTCSYFTAWVSTTSAAVPTAPGNGAFNQIQAAITGNSSLLTGRIRISLAATTTVYLSTQMGFAVAGMGAYGFIGARRVR